jgi:hypothetical protein
MVAHGVSHGEATKERSALKGRHLWKAKSRALWVGSPRAHDFVGACWAIGLVGCRPVRARSSAVDLAHGSCSRMLRLGSGLFASQTPLWASRAIVVSGLDRGPNQKVGPQLASRPFEAVPEPKRSGARPDCVMIPRFSGPSLAPRGRSRWAARSETLCIERRPPTGPLAGELASATRRAPRPAPIVATREASQTPWWPPGWPRSASPSGTPDRTPCLDARSRTEWTRSTAPP